MRNLTERWLFVFRDHAVAGNVEKTISLLPRAKAAGFNAILLGDHNLLSIDSKPDSYRKDLARLCETIRGHGFRLIASCMPVGYAGSILARDPNLAEGVPVKGARFVASGGELRFEQDPPVSILNGSFASSDGERFDDWDSHVGLGETLFPESGAAPGGGMAVRTEITEKPCQLTQSVKLQPFRHYLIRVRTKIQDMDNREGGEIVVRATDEQGRMRRLNYACLRGLPTSDWREQHAVFNSFRFTEARVGIGTSSEGTGTVWWSDMSIEETALLNVLRREGCPVSVRGDDGAEYEEGRDFEPIVDPRLDPSELYHTPPTVKLTPNTRIPEGAIVRIDYYHPLFIYGDQVCACLSDPKIYEIMRDQVVRLNEHIRPDAFLMSQDEMRSANSDAACLSRNMTPGQLMADNIRKSAKIIRDLRPDAKIWIWSDMIDPYHNAKEGPYYFVEGSFEGSWEGADPDIGIANWAGHLKGKNCRFFAERGHQQILSGYYDYDDDGAAIAAWLESAKDVPGVVGAMHTSWQEKFDTLEAWARKAWGGGSTE